MWRDLRLRPAHAPGADEPSPVCPLQLRGLACQVRGRAVLHSLDLRLEAGSLCLLYGANGAGKSTLFKLLAGLLEGQPGVRLQGEGWVMGQPLLGRDGQARARIGYMPQQGGLYEELNVLDNLRFRAEVLGLPEPAAAVSLLMADHGLTPLARQRLGQLSGGWRQRVAFAACTLPKPRLLLLDEPTAGIDLMAKAALWQHIHGLRREGVAVMVSSHDSDDAQQCPDLLALSQGHLRYVGSTQALALQPGADGLPQGLLAGLCQLLQTQAAAP